MSIRINKLTIISMMSFSLLVGCAKAEAPEPPTSTEPAATATQPLPTETAKPKVTVFSSERYGYTITLPGTWYKMIEIPGQWDGITNVLPGNPGTDVFKHSASESFPPFEIGFMPVPEGTTLESWAEAEGPRALFPGCQLSAQLTPAIVAGQPALIQAETGCNPIEVGVVNVYLVYKDQGILIQGFNIGALLTPILEGFELPE